MSRTSHSTLMENLEMPLDWNGISNEDMEILKRLMPQQKIKRE